MYYFEYFYAPLFKMQLMYYRIESVIVEFNSKSGSYDMHAKVVIIMNLSSHYTHYIATW